MVVSSRQWRIVTVSGLAVALGLRATVRTATVLIPNAGLAAERAEKRFARALAAPAVGADAIARAAGAESGAVWIEHECRVAESFILSR